MARQTRSDRRARRQAQREAGDGAATPRQRARDEAGAPEAAPERQPAGGGVRRFVGESIGELKKVEWPRQPQVVAGTTVVLVACVIVGIFLWVNDRIWTYVVQNWLLG